MTDEDKQPPPAAPDDGAPKLAIELSPALRFGAAISGLALAVVASIAVLRGTDGSALLAFVLVAAVFGIIALAGQIPQRIGGGDYALEMYRQRLQETQGELAAATEVMTPDQLEEAAAQVATSSGPSYLASTAQFERYVEANVALACLQIGAVETKPKHARSWDLYVEREGQTVFVEIKANVSDKTIWTLANKVRGTDVSVLLVSENPDLARALIMKAYPMLNRERRSVLCSGPSVDELAHWLMKLFEPNY